MAEEGGGEEKDLLWEVRRRKNVKAIGELLPVACFESKDRIPTRTGRHVLRRQGMLRPRGIRRLCAKYFFSAMMSLERIGDSRLETRNGVG